MEKGKLDIENLFRKELKDFQQTPPDHAWSAIEKSIGTSTKMSSIKKILISSSIVIGVASTIYIFNSYEKDQAILNQPTIELIDQEKSNISETFIEKEENKKIEKNNVIVSKKASSLKEEKQSEVSQVADGKVVDAVGESDVLIKKKKKSIPKRKEKTLNTVIPSEEITEIEPISVKEVALDNTTDIIKAVEIQLRVTENTIKYSLSIDQVEGDVPLTVAINNYVNNGEYAIKVDQEIVEYSEKEIFYTFEEFGLHEIELIRFEGDKEIVLEKKIVYAKPISKVFIPEAFTPNNDLNNEYFKATCSHIEQITFHIYNAQGDLIYLTTAIDHQGWDGNLSNGSKAVVGTYLYHVKARGIDGQEIDLKGKLQLIR